MTIWFPIRLAGTIKRCLPTVEPFDDLGQRRSSQELEREYQRRLERDKSPFNFLYNGQFSSLISEPETYQSRVSKELGIIVGVKLQHSSYY